MGKMKKFLFVFGTSFTVYFIMDYVFDNVMLYILGGVIGGTIGEVLNFFGVETGYFYIILIWLALLAVVIFLFYRLRSQLAKYFIVFAIALLLYVVDIAFAVIPISEMADSDGITLRDNLLIGVIIFSKSLIISIIIYFDKIIE